MARTPSLAVSSAAVLAPAALRSTMPMSAPSAASAPTIARPIPLAPPVTSATLPLSLPMVVILSYCRPLVPARADAQVLASLGERRSVGLYLCSGWPSRRRLRRETLRFAAISGFRATHVGKAHAQLERGGCRLASFGRRGARRFRPGACRRGKDVRQLALSVRRAAAVS